jgi:hypothetical protein
MAAAAWRRGGRNVITRRRAKAARLSANPATMEHLKRQQDFVAAARAPSAAMPGLWSRPWIARISRSPPGLHLQQENRQCGDPQPRQRRLLKPPALFWETAQNGFDYVLIGRMATAKEISLICERSAT